VRAQRGARTAGLRIRYQAREEISATDRHILIAVVEERPLTSDCIHVSCGGESEKNKLTPCSNARIPRIISSHFTVSPGQKSKTAPTAILTRAGSR